MQKQKNLEREEGSKGVWESIKTWEGPQVYLSEIEQSHV